MAIKVRRKAAKAAVKIARKGKLTNPVIGGDTYVAVFEPDDDGYWLVSIPAAPPAQTQARGIKQGLERIREALALVIGDRAAEQANIDIKMNLPAKDLHEIEQVRQLRIRAHEANQSYAETARRCIDDLTHRYSMRDVGFMLGVSGQRIAARTSGSKRKAG